MAKRKINDERKSEEHADDNVKEEKRVGVDEKAEGKKHKEVEEKATVKNYQSTMDKKEMIDLCSDDDSDEDSFFFKSSSDSCSGNVSSGRNLSGGCIFDPLNLFGGKQRPMEGRGKLVIEDEAEKPIAISVEEAGNARKRRNNIGVSRKEIELVLGGHSGFDFREPDEISDRNSVIVGYEGDEQVKGQKSTADGTTDVKIEAQRRVVNTDEDEVKALPLTSVKMEEGEKVVSNEEQQQGIESEMKAGNAAN